MKVLGFIPARAGSKGLPGKNKKLMLGKPLISYTIEVALESNLTDIVVSSDDLEILEIARKYDINVIERPQELAGDLTPTLPVMLHAVNQVDGDFDAVMTLQVTSPLRRVEHINECIKLFEEDENADSLVSVVKVPHKFSESSLMICDGNYIRPIVNDNIVLRRQDKQVAWARNGAVIYITRINKIGEYIFGGNIIPYEMSKIDSIDIDDIDDWRIAEAIMKNRQNQ